MIGLNQLQKDAGFKTVTESVYNRFDGFVFSGKDVSKEVKYIIGVDGFDGIGLALFNASKEYIELVESFESSGDCMHEEYEEEEAIQEMNEEEKKAFFEDFPNWKDSGACPACWLYDVRWEVKDHAWEIEDFLYSQYIEDQENPSFTLADEIIYVDMEFLENEITHEIATRGMIAESQGKDC